MKRVLPLLLILLLPAFALNAEWRRVDVNSDGTPEHVAVTNLADIAFDEQGRIVGWFVKRFKGQDYKDNYQGKINLVKEGLPLPGTLEGLTNPTAEFTQQGDLLVAAFQAEGLEIVYTINPQFYTVDLTVTVPTQTTLYWSGINGTDRPVTKLLPPGDTVPLQAGQSPFSYIAFQTKPKAGFALVLRPDEVLEGKVTLENNGAVAAITLPAGTHRLQVYGGQNELVRFYVEGYYDLPGLFQANIWGTLSLGLIYIMETAYRFTGNWGLAILVLTLFVRLLLWPLMHQQFKSMAELNRLKPLMDEINKKYKNDPEKRTEALMKMYQEHKVNPASGCLPLFIQLPILFILWRVIANFEFGQGFLWLPDLALPDPYYILPILYVGVMIVQTLLMAHGNKDIIRQSIFMNLFFVYLVLQFPSGVTLYWVFSTLIGLGQQLLINKQLGITPAKAG
ncbi:YidC/Oxa1 family membrane protein insertase [Marinithermus hydrothermalis]|uniref:Membrane protein insertase YidC n=1 Tax=Marinithermus hydrothermalis (strain DSM 14884 / JCM 11576 / T1) TaxID=869210 RepID=F2NM95_MARHT|nr:YidC/Oxa1 family membrane protein insertase [Marinithermus hydrothermalis]AEB11783.1 membrane protein insertase, YidC/Oxa1 family [Marinithermus hydrothermalis DSM 14884]